MKNFSDSWQNFLSESAKPKKVPFEDTRIRIKRENKEKILREVTDEEFEHIQTAVGELGPEELAFNAVFEGKNRIVIDFPTLDLDNPLGSFINMWQVLDYEVDWEKGTISGEKMLRDTSPQGFATSMQSALDPQLGAIEGKKQKINMKIGKWLAKVYQYRTKYDVLVKKASDFYGGMWRETGAELEQALNEEELKAYYRLNDRLLMMLRVADPDRGSRPPRVTSAGGLRGLMDYWQKNAAYIKKNLNEALQDNYSIIITRDPIDIWRMADFDNITSCHSPPSRGGAGSYYKCAVAEAHGHGAVAYIVKTEDLLHATNTSNIASAEQEIQEGEIFYDSERGHGDGGELEPVSRLRLRQVRFYKGQEVTAGLDPSRSPHEGIQLAVPEQRVYGANIPGFADRVIDWAREEQQATLIDAPRSPNHAYTKHGDAPWLFGTLDLNNFIKFGGSHDDTTMSTLLIALYGKDMPTVGRVTQDTDTEDNLDVNLVAGLLERYQIEIDEIDERFNAMMAAVRVSGTAVDDGDGGVYITCEAELLIRWDSDEFNRWPSIENIGYALEEVKEWGLGWMKSDYPYQFRKTPPAGVLLPIEIRPEGLVGWGGQEYAYAPDDYEDFCDVVNHEVDEKREFVKLNLTTFFKREGDMKGGGVMKLGADVISDNMNLYHWEGLAEESGEIDEFEYVMFTAHPEVLYKELGATPEQASVIMNDRNFWLEIRKRMAKPAFENTGSKMYPQMPLDMDMFGYDGTEDETQELNLYFSIHDDAHDQQAEVLRNLVEIWDDQDEINRVANEVFRDMLEGTVAHEGTAVGDLHEELNTLRVERILKRLTV